MKKAIITTTINPPTEAIKKFAEIAAKQGWHMYIVGDQKTPHSEYELWASKWEGNVTYIDPIQQEKINKELSDLIGWNCIQRRNFGFIQAHRDGADVFATVDDDNIPYPNWGQNVRVGQSFGISTFESDLIVFDPVGPAFPMLWHRGFPVQLIHKRHVKQPKPMKRKVLVQADLWDGDPDIDAICRIGHRPTVRFNPAMSHYAGDKPMPFNSQNTFLAREVIPQYFLFPDIGRMDDIWAAYWVQKQFGQCVAFYKATVVQKRNEHDLIVDMEKEMLGYKHTLDYVQFLFGGKDQEGFTKYIHGERWPTFMPDNAIKAFKLYRSLFEIS